MARWIWVLLAVAAAGTACTSVKVAQRDGCWVRKTEKWLGDSKEDLGPCVLSEPKWSDDRLTRLMQECAVRADYRWQTRALESWDRGEPLPEHPSEEKVLQQCLGEPTRAVLAENDALRGRNDALQKRISELSSDRDAAMTSADDARKRLTGGYEKIAEKMTDYLGTAANKAQGPATATASASSDSKGTARTQNAHDATTSVATSPDGGASIRARSLAPKKARAARPPAEAPVCPPSTPAADAPATPARSEAVWAPSPVIPQPTSAAPPTASRSAGAAP